MTWTLLAGIGMLAAFGAAISISRQRRETERWAAKRNPPRPLTLKERIAATEPEIKRQETAA